MIERFLLKKNELSQSKSVKHNNAIVACQLRSYEINGTSNCRMRYLYIVVRVCFTQTITTATTLINSSSAAGNYYRVLDSSSSIYYSASVGGTIEIYIIFLLLFLINKHYTCAGAYTRIACNYFDYFNFQEEHFSILFFFFF